MRRRIPDVTSSTPACVDVADVTVPPLTGVNVERNSGVLSGSMLYAALMLNPTRPTPLDPVSQFSQPAAYVVPRSQ
jgi:hypothetical protein